jgi:hypothetical protein
MGDRDDFYLVLASNVAPKTFPHNAPNHFYTPLRQPIHLDGPSQWKVCLSELTYQNSIRTIINESIEIWKINPGELELIECMDYDEYSSQYLINTLKDDDKSHTYFLDENAIKNKGYNLEEGIVIRVERYNVIVKEYTFKEENASFTFDVTPHRNEKLKIFGKRKTKLMKTITLTPGYYHTEEKLCEEINRLLGKTIPGITFRITGNGEGKRFELETLQDQYYLLLKNDLHFILGFKEEKLVTPSPQVATFKADLVRGSFAMFIYCDICEPMMVGDMHAPLLRTSHIHDSQHGSVVNQVFNPPLYVNVCKPNISVIEVDIRTDSGLPFPLSPNGKLILTLHFARRMDT